MKFSHGKRSPFYDALEAEIKKKLTSDGSTRFGGRAIYFKIVILLGLQILLYFTIILGLVNPTLTAVLAVFFIANSAFLFFNIAHDASHGTISKNRKVNRALCLISDLVGVNSYMWHIRHDIQHHSYTNVMGGDLIIESLPLLRFSESQRHLTFHKLQPYYAPIIYSLYSIYWIFVLDFRYFSKKEICTLNNVSHPVKEWIKLILFKGLYITYMIVIPILVMPYTIGGILLVFLIGHLLTGLIISLVAVYGHHMDEIDIVIPTEDQKIAGSWGIHECNVTSDFGRRSLFLTWILGGLNHHVCHHLFPNICHVHFYKITPIIKEMCQKFEITYNEYSLTQAFISHRQFLRRLSTN